MQLTTSASSYTLSCPVSRLDTIHEMAAGQCHNAVFTRLSTNHPVLIVDFHGHENRIV